MSPLKANILFTFFSFRIFNFFVRSPSLKPIDIKWATDSTPCFFISPAISKVLLLVSFPAAP